MHVYYIRRTTLAGNFDSEICPTLNSRLPWQADDGCNEANDDETEKNRNKHQDRKKNYTSDTRSCHGLHKQS